MNSLYNPIKLLLLAVLVVSCNSKTKPQITHADDYNAYLFTTSNDVFDRAQKNEAFWTKKLEKNTNQYPYLAQLANAYTNFFSTTGTIEYLKKAESYLVQLNTVTNYNKPAYLKRLAYNFISQHRFQDALKLLTKAELLGEDLQETRKMLFDVHLELGNDDLAHVYLNTFENFSDFDYLIRLSKWSDHKGNLSAAIKYMEKAMHIAEASNLNTLKLWSYANIADFYGHAGEIEKSYQFYLKALELNPNEAYAKKGIAWIVYSHENNPEEALRILNSVTSSYFAPDYYLLKAEIAQYIEKEEFARQQLSLYDTAMQNKAYGDMYNTHNVLLYIDSHSSLDKAIALAQKEVDNRPTPQSYDLLAWTYFKNGNVTEALRIIESHVVNKTFEPDTLYHIAEIYKAAGKTSEVKPLKDELLASIYELGPAMKTKINQL